MAPARRGADRERSESHYFVTRDSSTREEEPLVLRRYRDDHFADLAFEREVMTALADAGWPVPRVVDYGRISGADWLLMTRCAGESRRRTASEAFERGRLLARFHQVLEHFARDRSGFPHLEEVVGRRPLEQRLRTLKPELAGLLSRYLDATRQMFERVTPDAARQSVVHGDFVAWNLLYDGSRLGGVIDFESCHRGPAVADFAGAWRGRYDPVITGYETERPLDDAERTLIVPIFWAWLFLGIDHDLERGERPTFEWQLGQFARRDSVFFEPWRTILP